MRNWIAIAFGIPCCIAVFPLWIVTPAVTLSFATRSRTLRSELLAPQGPVAVPAQERILDGGHGKQPNASAQRC